MIGVLSWSGRGLVVLLLLFLPIGLMIALENAQPELSLIAFGAAWIVSGIVCLVLGKRWNAVAPLHKFGKLRMEIWGYIFIGLGLLITIPRIAEWMKARHTPPPIRRR